MYSLLLKHSEINAKYKYRCARLERFYLPDSSDRKFEAFEALETFRQRYTTARRHNPKD